MDIRLRALEESDLPQLRDWRNDDQLRHTFRGYQLLNMINQHDWLDHISRSREVEMFGIELAFEGGVNAIGHSISVTMGGWKLVGVCGLCNINWVNRMAEISLYITPELPIAPEMPSISDRALGLLRQKAFGEFDLRRLWAEVYEFRPVAIARLERCGYVLEGRLRKHVFKQGRYHDSLIYGLLREEA